MTGQTFPYSNDDVQRWLDQSMEVLQHALQKIAEPDAIGAAERNALCGEVSIVASVVTYLGQRMLAAARENPDNIPELPFVKTPEILEMLQDIDRVMSEVCQQLELPRVTLN